MSPQSAYMTFKLQEGGPEGPSLQDIRLAGMRHIRRALSLGKGSMSDPAPCMADPCHT